MFVTNNFKYVIIKLIYVENRTLMISKKTFEFITISEKVIIENVDLNLGFELHHRLTFSVEILSCIVLKSVPIINN